MGRAGDRFPLLKSLLERCLSLHAEDRPGASDALGALEGLKADPCSYRPAGHGAGVLADRWFQVGVMDTGLQVFLVNVLKLLLQTAAASDVGSCQQQVSLACVDRKHAIGVPCQGFCFIGCSCLGSLCPLLGMGVVNQRV